MSLLAFLKAEQQNLVSYVRRMLREAGDRDAEDIVQDVALRLLERADSGPDLENMTAYVYRSLRNRVIDSHRARRPVESLDGNWQQGESLLDTLEDDDPTLLEQVVSNRNRDTLFQGLSGLTEREQQVIIAHEFEGQSYKDISASLAIPVNTLLSLKSRAIVKLKNYFAQAQEMHHE